MNDLNPQCIPYLAVARFNGEDAGSFLQSQLSADILALEPGGTTLACYCTPQGKVLGLLLVGHEDNGYLLAGRRELLPGILQRLKMYVLRSKVVIADAVGTVVEGTAGPEYRFARGECAAAEAAAWRLGELQGGVCWLDADSADRYIPQMLGFDTIGAVSFRKGCYPGQEIVARARYLGQVKRKPAIVATSGTPAMKTGGKLRLSRGGEWSNAVLVDRAESGGRQVLFTIARAAEAAVEAVEIKGEVYRCATM